MTITKIVDNVAENLTRGKWIPMNSVKSRNYFVNLGYTIEDMGHIESDNPSLAYMVGSCCT